jgi:hypothetical protein
MGTLVMPKSTAVVAPPAIKPRERRLWRLILFGGFFMLLGALGTLAWAFRDSWQVDPGPLEGKSLRARPTATAPAKITKPAAPR